MRVSLAALLDRSAPDLSLVSAATFRGFDQIATSLGDTVCQAAFEHRLGGRRGGTDLLVCVQTRDGGREALRDSPLGRAGGPIGRFVKAWCDRRSPLHARVPFIWLEYDEGRNESPLLFFSPQPGFGDGFSPISSDASLDDLMLAAFEALDGKPPPPEVKALLKRAPESACLLHATSLAPRGGVGVRLVVAVPSGRVKRTIHSLAGRAVGRAAARVLDEIPVFSGGTSLHFDVHASAEPKIGIEYHRLAPISRDREWSRLFDQMVASGSCTEKERRAAEAWTARPLSGGPLWKIRTPAQVKLVAGPGRPLEAKLYLGMVPEGALFP